MKDEMLNDVLLNMCWKTLCFCYVSYNWHRLTNFVSNPVSGNVEDAGLQIQ